MFRPFRAIFKGVQRLPFCTSIADFAMSQWSLKSPDWSNDCLSLLSKVDLNDDLKQFTIEEIIENSEKHPVKFPIDTGRLKTIKNKKTVTEEYLEKCINSAYPFVHENVLNLFAKFLILKRNYGSSVEKVFYQNINLKDFIERLIKKRAVMFMGKDDKYMLITGERGSKNWESIGTDREKPPLTLQNCLSYDEIKLSAFLYASSYTHFVNKGDRKNKAVYCEDRSKIQEEGIIAGLIGPRLKKEGVMDFQEIVVTAKQNQESNGYGGQDSVHKLFSEFYGEENVLFRTLNQRKSENPASRYADIKTPKGAVFDNQIYNKRLSIVFDCLLLEANFRANQADRTAYINVVGFGLGVWRISDHQEKCFVDCFYDRILALSKKLTSVSDICFSYINQESCGGYKNGDTISIKDHPSKGIRIHIFKRQPHEKLVNENRGKLLVASYAWDGNALPGNEFWDGKLGSSGDSAAASSTQISELHNPHINPLISVDNLRIVTCNGKVMKLHEYIKNVQTLKVKKNSSSNKTETGPSKKKKK